MKKVSGLIVAAVLTLGLCVIAYAAPQNSTAPQPPQGQQKAGQLNAPSKPSQEEMEAFRAIQNELDPIKAIALVKSFEKNYPNSPALAFVYLKAADAYRQKGDVQDCVSYGEKSLKLKPDNPVALILVASVLPEPQSLKAASNQSEKEQKLTEAESYGSRALKLIHQLPKPPNFTEPQYEKAKANLESWAHSSLGMVHLQRSSISPKPPNHAELAKAEKEYQDAVRISQRPDPADYFRLGEAYANDGKVNEAVQAYSKASQLDQRGQIKTLANQAIQDLKKRSEAKPATQPAQPKQ